MNCLNCGNKFDKRGSKKFCNSNCAGYHWRKNNPEKRKASWRKYNTAHLEEIEEKCRARRKEHPEIGDNYRKINRLENNARTRAKYAMKKSGVLKICRDCRSDKRICVHHIDKNPFNNSLNNLAYLCIKCHSLIHQT